MPKDPSRRTGSSYVPHDTLIQLGTEFLNVLTKAGYQVRHPRDSDIHGSHLPVEQLDGIALNCVLNIANAKVTGCELAGFGSVADITLDLSEARITQEEDN